MLAKNPLSQNTASKSLSEKPDCNPEPYLRSGSQQSIPCWRRATATARICARAATSQKLSGQSW